MQISVRSGPSLVEAIAPLPNPMLPSPSSLSLEATLSDLRLHGLSMELDASGAELSLALDADPLLPGTVLLDRGQFVGLLSRRQFLKHLSRQYGPELFLGRPLRVLYQYTQAPVLVFAANTSIIAAARAALSRAPNLLYEPVVVQLATGDYALLDVHQLLIAQSQIHELAMQHIQEQSRAQIFQTEKMASLGQMMAGIAHEIKNPVNFIAGNVSYLAQYAQDLIALTEAYETELSQPSSEIAKLRSSMEIDFLKQDLPKLIASMRVGADQLKKTVAGLQHFSHVGSGERKPANLHECLDSTLIVLNNRLKEGVTLVKNYGDLPPVVCYSGQLSQVFMNLLANAIDALLEEWNDRHSTPESKLALGQSPSHSSSQSSGQWQPQITITTRLLSDREVLGDPAPAGKSAEIAPPIAPTIASTGDEPSENPAWVAIEIADNGPGIPDAIQTKIFETFFTTKPIGKGTGLGLAISHEIVAQRHGGYLRLRSPLQSQSTHNPEPNTNQLGPLPGTAFEVLLPLTPPTDTPSQPARFCASVE